MNPFINKLLEVTAIDIEHLINKYLTSSQLKYLDENLKSEEDFANNFSTSEEGENLEMLLHFLSVHKSDITELLRDPSQKHILIELYTSSVISRDYDCFSFDLSQFEQTYNPQDETLTLYRIGREGEDKESLGNSWSKSYEGLEAYAQSSSANTSILPVFEITIDDSQVLFEGNSQEDELVLRKGFVPNRIKTRIGPVNILGSLSS